MNSLQIVDLKISVTLLRNIIVSTTIVLTVNVSRMVMDSMLDGRVSIGDASKELESIVITMAEGASEDEVKYKKPKSGTGKEKATDVPSWAKGNKPRTDQNGKDFAEELMNDRYGEGNWSTKSKEYSEIKKWGDRGFQ